MDLFKKLNFKRELKKSLRVEIVTYFEYYWAHDINNNLAEESDLRIFSELPNNIKIEIFKNFLFRDFIKAHNKLFEFPKFEHRKHSYYAWRDDEYSEFMITLMRNLKPRFYKAGKVFINELDSVIELNFLTHGSFAVGFELNKTKQFIRFYGERSTFGCYNCIFNKKSFFIW